MDIGEKVYDVCIAVERLTQEFRNSNYNPEKILKYLNTDWRRVTVGALFESTKKKEIRINEEPGRTAWRTVFDFYQEKGLDSFDMQHKLYEITASDTRQLFLGMIADFTAGTIKAANLGFYPGYKKVEAIRRKAYAKYFTRWLYPDSWKKVSTAS